jgi:hypothetical protein
MLSVRLGCVLTPLASIGLQSRLDQYSGLCARDVRVHATTIRLFMNARSDIFCGRLSLTAEFVELAAGDLQGMVRLLRLKHVVSL